MYLLRKELTSPFLRIHENGPFLIITFKCYFFFREKGVMINISRQISWSTFVGLQRLVELVLSSSGKELVLYASILSEILVPCRIIITLKLFCQREHCRVQIELRDHGRWVFILLILIMIMIMIIIIIIILMINLIRCCPNFPEGKDPRQHHKILHAHCLQCLHWVRGLLSQIVRINKIIKLVICGWWCKKDQESRIWIFQFLLPGKLPRGKKSSAVLAHLFFSSI